MNIEQLGYAPETISLVPKLIPSLLDKEVHKVSCGLHHTAFITTDGRIYTCGNNENSQLGLKDTHSRYSPTIIDELSSYRFKDIACGYYHTLALTEHGEVFVFGRNDKGQLGIVNFKAN